MNRQLKPNFKRKFDHRKWANQDAIKEINGNVSLTDWDKVLEKYKELIYQNWKGKCLNE